MAEGSSRTPLRISERTARGLAVVGCAVVVSGAVVGLRAVGFLERMELAAYDHYVRLTHQGPELGDRVLVVTVTEEDIQTLGQWPMSDGLMAQVIEKLTAHGPRAIGFDIYRDLPVAPGSEHFDEALLAHPRVVWITKYADGRSRGVPPPRVLREVDHPEYRAGFNDLIVDVDGLVRRGLLFMDDDRGGTGWSFPLLLSLYYLSDEGISPEPDPDDPDWMRFGETTFTPLGPNGGAYVGTDARGVQFLADYRRAPVHFPTLGLIEMLGAGEELHELVYGRIVVLGVVASSEPDFFYIPFERDGTTEVPGVVLHAYLASQIIRYALGEDTPIRLLPDGAEALAIAAFALVGSLLGLVSSSAGRFTAIAAITVPGLWATGYLGLSQGWWIPVVPAAVAWALSGTAVTAYLAGRVRAERAELMHLFSRHVAKEVAEDVWNRRDEFMAGGRPQPVRLTATVLFVDMKGYTGKADSLDPSDLMLWLNDYLELLSQDIMNAGGLIDDYFGDGIMAAFGLPVPRAGDDEIRDDAVAAVSCALSMERSVRHMNEKWRPRGYPNIGIRVGLATGVMVAGTIGSAERMKYSIVGDVVVTAQRLESLDDSDHDFDAEPLRVLIGPETLEWVKDAFEIREHGQVVLKGRSEPVAVNRVTGLLRAPEAGGR